MAGMKGKMTQVEDKIKNIFHKDNKGTTGTTGSGMTGTNTGYGAGADTNTQNTGLAGKAEQAMGGYDATTSTGAGKGVSGEEGARTGMADLDLSTGTNKDSSAVGATTGLREGGAGYGASTGGQSETRGTSGQSLGTTRTVNDTTGEIIDSERFTKTEDHEVVIEKKAYELEHRPVQKQYVVETKYEGERRIPGAATELLGTEAREVDERVVEAPRGNREVIVENVDIGVPVTEMRSERAMGTSGMTGGSTGMTGGSTGMTGGTTSGMGSGANTGYGTGTGTGGQDYSSTTGTGTGTGGQDYSTGTGTGTGGQDYSSTTGTGAGTTGGQY